MCNIDTHYVVTTPLIVRSFLVLASNAFLLLHMVLLSEHT